MNCVIIEDEKPAARQLSRLLQKMEIVPQAVLNSVAASTQWLKEHPDPDVLFLDIQLGDGISFEIFEEVQPKSAIIFTTAYDHYALRAFKLNSIDYLLKPIVQEDLKRAIDKYRSHQQAVVEDLWELKSILGQNFETPYRERFLLKIGNTLKTLRVEEISGFLSKDKATWVLSGQRTYLMESSLNELEKELSPQDFFRVSRSALLNLRFIEKINVHSGSRYAVRMKGFPEPFMVSRERVPDFRKWLEK